MRHQRLSQGSHIFREFKQFQKKPSQFLVRNSENKNMLSKVQAKIPKNGRSVSSQRLQSMRGQLSHRPGPACTPTWLFLHRERSCGRHMDDLSACTQKGRCSGTESLTIPTRRLGRLHFLSFPRNQLLHRPTLLLP